MDFVERMAGAFAGTRSQNTPSAKTLLSFTPLSHGAQEHLSQVYLTMAVALCLSAVGVYASVLTGFGQGLGMIGFMVCTPWLLSTPATPATLSKRRNLFGGAALSQGLLLAPLIRATLSLHPGVLFTAFAGTAGVFACFSAAALLSPRRQYLFLGGLLSSVLSTFLMLRLGTFFFGGAALLFQAELYIGLAVFAGYVVYDTQLIVERSEAGAKDVLRDALSLYTDFVAIFVRLLVILLRSAEEKQRREREREARSGAARRRDVRTTRLH